MIGVWCQWKLLGIALILGSCTVSDQRRFPLWTLTGYTLRVQEAVYLYPKQQLSSREIDFWYFCLHRTQCQASNHRTVLSILQALYPIRASTNKLTMSMLSLLLFIIMFCVFTKYPTSFPRGPHNIRKQRTHGIISIDLRKCQILLFISFQRHTSNLYTRTVSHKNFGTK